MASKFVLPQLALARRQMSGMAIKKIDGPISHHVEASLLPSGLRVSSLDSDSAAISTIGVLVKSGSSIESYDNLGASHAIRLSAGCISSKNATNYGIVKNIQQVGGHVNVIGTREYLLYSLTVPRSDVLNTFDYFNELVTQPSFKPWELNDHLPIRMLEDIKNMDMPTLALELLHKAAYRNGLGNSLYSPEFMVGKHDSDLLLDFHRKTHTLTRSAVAGHGIDHRTLCSLSNSLQLDKGHGPTQPCKYFGGELRENQVGDTAVIALCGESGPIDNVKESLAFMLLKNILGSGPKTKWGSVSGRLAKAVAKIEGEKAVAGINFSYRDSGLTGAIISCEANIAEHVVCEVLSTLRSFSVTDEELQAAKKTLLIETSEAIHNAEVRAETMAVNAMFGVEPASEMINMISTSDVNAAAKKLMNGKLSMSAVGNLKNLPYIDTL